MVSLNNPKNIQEQIHLIRNHKVILDKDLALLYDVKPIHLRQQVKRNINRFPEDFMFQVSSAEVELLVSQNVIPSRQHLGGHLPYVFTEQGVAMLSTVLNSERAIQVNIAIMRAFVHLKKSLTEYTKLAEKISALEQKSNKQDSDIQAIFQAIKQLITPAEKPRRRIGFH